MVQDGVKSREGCGIVWHDGLLGCGVVWYGMLCVSSYGIAWHAMVWCVWCRTDFVCINTGR